LGDHSQDPKDLFQGIWNDEKDQIAQLIRDSLDGDKLVWGYCPRCSKKVQVDYPDYKGRQAIIEMLLDRGWGKAATQPPKPEKPAETVLGEIGSLTDEQLAELADS